MNRSENFPDIWKYLSQTKKPIAIYGMGNGADKLFDLLSAHTIQVQAVFASDEFVRGQYFRGYRIMKAEEVFSTYPDAITLVAFGSPLPEVTEYIYSLAQNREVYIPDLPIAGNPKNGDTYFCFEFYMEHKSEFDEARSLFHDDKSKEIFDLIIENKLTGSASALKNSANSNVYKEIWSEILHPTDYRSFLDLGAYRGDTLKELISVRNQIRSGKELYSEKNNKNFSQYADFDFYAFEPDSKNFKKLAELAKKVFDVTDSSQISESEQNDCIALNGDKHCFKLFNYAAWNSSGTADFSSGGNRNSNITVNADHGKKMLSGSKITTVKLAKVDDMVSDAVDYIKYDIEGAEYEALLGTRNLIANSPDLTVSAYHRPEDLFRLPLLIHELNPEYKLYLRRLPCIPAWEINIYAVK